MKHGVPIRRVSDRLLYLAGCLAAALTACSAAAQVEVIAHRGNSSATPENTIASIHSGFAVGADHIEVDIRLTSDGVAVLMHDSTVNRTTNGSGAISGMTLAQVQALDAGSWFGPEFAGETVPTLAEALVAANHRGRLLLDIKASGMGTAIQDAIDQANLISGGGFSASDLWLWPGPNADYESNITDPEYLLSSVPSASTWQTPGYFDEQRALGVVGWDVGGGMTAAFAAAARAEGMTASVYTINSVSSMQSFIDLGVTAMETDFPHLLVDLVWEPGDLDGDGYVGATDLDILLANWGEDVDPWARTLGDLTGDGTVGQADLDLVTANWGNGTPPASNIPEPGSLALLSAFLPALLRRWR